MGQCSFFESALATCREPEPDALQQCMLAYAGTVAGCDAGCTHAFCKCMEDARADAKTGAGAIGNGLIIACITFVLSARIGARTEFAAEQLAIACIDFVLSADQ